MSGTDARRAAVTREGGRYESGPHGTGPDAGDRALARVARGCRVAAFVVRLQAVLAAICLILAVVFTHDLVTRALDAGAPDVWTALYVSSEDGGHIGNGDIVTKSVSVSYEDQAGRTVQAPEGYAAIQSLAVGLPSSLCMLVTMLYAARLFDWVRESKRPFSDRVVHDLRNLALMVLVWALLPVLTCEVAFWLQPTMRGVSFDMSAGSTTLVMTAVLIWGVTCIFEYGVVLQRQDDETL